MKFAYGLITALTVVSSALATEDHAEHHAPEPHQDSHEHPAWLSHLRVGTTMHKGNFVSEENPLHKRNIEPHHELHDHHLHLKDDHHGHDATEIFLEHEHYHHDHHSYNVHSHPSCKALQTSTEHDAAVIENLLQSARSIAKGMEEVHKHLSEASEDEHHRHHSLWSEHIKTPCEVLEESTLIEMEIAEHLLEGALLVVKELKERWQHAGATVHVDEHGHDTHGHEHDNVYSAHHDAHVHPDHHDAHGHHDTHGHPEHHDTHGHPEHHDTHGHPEHHGDEHHEDHHWWDIFHHDEHYLEHDKGAHPHEIHPSDHAHHDAHHDAHHAAHHDEHGAHHDAHHNEHGDHKEHKESHGWFHWFEKHSPEDLKREHPDHH